MFKTTRDIIKRDIQVKPLTELPDEPAVVKKADTSEFDLNLDPAAKYKIEVQYIESRKLHEPSMVSVSAWESGKRFDGGGDEAMFWCIDAKEHTGGCGGLIPAGNAKNGMAMCPHCKNMINATRLPVERVGLFSARNLSKEVAKIYRHLDGNADIYLKFHETDTAGMTRLRSEGKKTTQRAIYTLKRLVQDTVGGSDVAKCIENFLTS